MFCVPTGVSNTAFTGMHPVNPLAAHSAPTITSSNCASRTLFLRLHPNNASAPIPHGASIANAVREESLCLCKLAVVLETSVNTCICTPTAALPLNVTEVGWKRQTELVGSPLQDGLIVPEKLKTGVAVISPEATPPCAMAREELDAASVKSGAGAETAEVEVLRFASPL